jgi:DNA repair exonuclease SbcCD ATPase subunit
MDGDNTKEVEVEEEVASIKPVVGRHLCGRTLPDRRHCAYGHQNGASKEHSRANDSLEEDHANGSTIDSLQQRLEDEKERNRSLERQMHLLSVDAELAATLKDELQKERKRSQSLEQQLQTLSNSSSSEGDKLSQLQKALEEERSGRAQDVVEGKKRLREVEEAKEHLDGQYKTLLGRVSTIRSTLGERLKADAVCFFSYVCTSCLFVAGRALTISANGGGAGGTKQDTAGTSL